MQEPDTEICANILDALNECLQVGLIFKKFSKLLLWLGLFKLHLVCMNSHFP